MKTAKTNAQQGDVVLRKVITAAGKVVSRGRCVLAEGEATGHAHIVDDEEAELLRDGERILLRLTRAATVVHEEHKPIRLSPGVWEIGRVQEYDYFSRMARPVAD